MDTQDLADDFKGLKITESQDINILLLGETGVGKSTFINSIANYLSFKSFKKATKNQLQILIPSVITVTNRNFEQVTIHIGCEDKNEFQEIGVAGTQNVKTYVFPIGEGKTRLRLIDSPGMGDPRGIEQDDINCENILAYLAQLKELHAICFLMKPTTTRITVFFEYCVKQILSRLEKSASRNIIFIFTNTRGTNYTPGDTLPCLRKIVDEIKAKPPKVDIPLKDNIFSVDNEAFRYLVALQNGIDYDDHIKERFIESWNKSSKECWRLIAYIVGDAAHDPLKPHQLQNTMSINEARRLIVQLSQPLADISQLIYDNIRILDKHKNNLKMENQSLDELKRKLYIPVINLEVTQLTQPVTVCTSSKCAEMIKVGDKTKPHYRQRCHDPCYLTNVQKEIVGDPNLINCAAMNGSRTCVKCTCDYLVHMHVYYMTKTVDDRIVDAVVQKNINEKEVAVREAHQLIRQIDNRKTELEEEREIVIRSTAQFAHFLQHNAISPFNDSYKSYITYLISREQSLGKHGDQGVIENLKHLMRRYEEIKAAFDQSLTLSKQHGLQSVLPSSETAQSVMKTIHNLYQLRHNGKKIHELINKQKASRNSEYDKTCEYIHQSITGMYTGESKKDISKKNKKKDSKSTDDEKTKKDYKKDGKTSDKTRPYDRKYKNFSHNQGNRNYHQTHQSRSSYTLDNDPPPPYTPTIPSRNEQSAFVKKSNSDDKFSVTVQFSKQKSKKPEDKNYPSYQQGLYQPQQTPFHGPPLPQPSYPAPGLPPSQQQPYPAPHSQYPGAYYPPPQGYYGQPSGPYGANYGYPPVGQYCPPQGPYGAPQGQYGQQYGGPVPQNQQGRPGGRYQRNEQGRGRPYQNRGGNQRRGRSKPRNDKKSGNEKSGVSSESSSD